MPWVPIPGQRRTFSCKVYAYVGPSCIVCARYWVAFENMNGVRGPFSDSVSDKTAMDVTAAFESLLDEVVFIPLFEELGAPITIPEYITDELGRIQILLTSSYPLSTIDRKMLTLTSMSARANTSEPWIWRRQAAT